MRKFVSAVLVLALLCLVCGGALAAAKDTLNVADQYDATSLDPIGHNDVPSNRACFHLYDTLIFKDENEVPNVPGLAEKWEFLSDTEYKFYLRKGVKFHNGEEMTAEDVAYTFLRAASEAGTRIRTYSENIKDAKVIDPYTVVVELKVPDYSFFSSLTMCWANIVNKKAVEAAGENYGMNPVGTGPFKFVEWAKGDHYTFERFDDFWGEKPNFKTLTVRSIPEPTNRTIELETGQADLIYPVITNDLSRIGENPDLVLLRAPQTSVTYLGFNTTKKPFDDVRVRRAIDAALDTVGIQRAVWRGVGRVPRAMVPSAIMYSINDEMPEHVRDLEKARALFKEAGIDPSTLSITIRTNERKERVDMAQIIQAQLGELGIKSQIMQQEWGAYLQALREKQHDVFLLGWSSAADPNFSLTGLLQGNAPSNYTFFANKEFDDLLAKGRSVPNGDERAKIYRDAQLLLIDQCPMVYLHNDESIVGTQKFIKGFTPSTNEVHSFRTIRFED